MDIQALMTDAVVMVEPDDRLDTAEILMSLAESRHVPVVCDGQLVGIISQRDVLGAKRGSRLLARDIMTRAPVTIGPHDSVRRAAELLRSHRISSLPVVEDGGLVGILTSCDLVAYAAESLRDEEPTPAVAELMHPQPLLCVQSSERLDVARLLMQAGPCRHLPVFEGRRLVGILSDRDVLEAAPSRHETLNVPERIRREAAIAVGGIMSEDIVTVAPGDAAAAAADLLVHLQIGALPVVDGDRLIGIITESDFLDWLRR